MKNWIEFAQHIDDKFWTRSSHHLIKSSIIQMTWSWQCPYVNLGFDDNCDDSFWYELKTKRSAFGPAQWAMWWIVGYKNHHSQSDGIILQISIRQNAREKRTPAFWTNKNGKSKKLKPIWMILPRTPWCSPLCLRRIWYRNDGDWYNKWQKKRLVHQTLWLYLN